ncbi:MAG: hypothetical protein LBI33_12935 [Propionibacteriaceae bacterium]|nr:hypothetical protein [Propionibacteriaceae bacterium]
MADFRAVYHLDWDDQVWQGNPDTTLRLVDGLRSRPDSLYRATILRDSPPAPGDTDGLALSWHGLDQATWLLAQIHNILAARVYGPDGPRIDPPHPPPDPIDLMWQATGWPPPRAPRRKETR